jgi:hypothetical protein
VFLIEQDPIKTHSGRYFGRKRGTQVAPGSGHEFTAPGSGHEFTAENSTPYKFHHLFESFRAKYSIHKQAFDVPFKQVLTNMFGDHRVIFFKGIQIPITQIGCDLKPDVQ